MSNEGFFDKVKDFVTGHPEQADQGMDKAEEILDERTGGKYSEQIGQGSDKIREQLGIPDNETTTPPSEPAPQPVPSPQPGPAPTPGTEPAPGEPTPTPGTAPEPPSVPNPTEPGTPQPQSNQEG